MLDSGARAIVPGHADKARWSQRISTTDADERMPPASTGKQLTAAQMETLRRWIDQGARYEAHWAFIPPRRVEPPAGGGRSSDRSLHSALGLRKKRSSRAAEADRATLVRRLSFDLIGLPPSPLEVDAFVTRSAARRLRARGRSLAGLANILASAGPGGGSTWPTMPTATATCRISSARRPGGIGNGWSMP